MRSFAYPTRRAVMASTAALFLGTKLGWSQQPTDVRLGVDSGVLGAQIWVAKDKGLFEKHGINANVLTFAYGIDTVDAELTGRSDFGIALDFPTITRLVTGQLKIVSSAIEPAPGFYVFVARKPIASANDLGGKTLGISKATLQHLMTIKFVETGGLKASDVTMVGLSSNLEIVGALRAGQIDGAFLTKDAVEQVKNLPEMTILGDDSVIDLRRYGYITVSKQFAEAQPQAVSGVLAALAEATDWIAANPDAAAELVAKNSKSKLDVVKAQMSGQHYTIALKPEYLATFKAVAEFALEAGMTKQLVDPAGYIDSSFLKQVDPSRVTLP